MHNIYYFLIIGITVIFFVFNKFVSYLNTKYWSDELPEELKGIYDEQKYKKSMQYQKELYKFRNISSWFSIVITLLILIFFGYWYLDLFLRKYIENWIILWLVFFGIIQTFSFIISKPFSWYANFHIEEKYWFNKMTPKIFITDSIKELLMAYVIWWIILWPIIRFYWAIWTNFWLYAWWLITVFFVFIQMFYSNIIVPLFNKQTPLEEWELKEAIINFAKKVSFQVENIYIMDGSKRSTRANAYFTWLWYKKRIVLYDTLIKDYSKDEIIAVIAHEIWHYKKKHTLQSLIFSIIETWIMLYLFSIMVSDSQIALALWTHINSFHIWLLAFSTLFTPISEVFGILWNMLSRKNEYEADTFAWVNFDPKFLQSWLKKLSVDNLSNLRPHPIYEFINYSHPTLLKRLSNLDKIKK